LKDKCLLLQSQNYIGNPNLTSQVHADFLLKNAFPEIPVDWEDAMHELQLPPFLISMLQKRQSIHGFPVGELLRINDLPVSTVQSACIQGSHKPQNQALHEDLNDGPLPVKFDCTGDVYLYSQADVDAFTCTEVSGMLPYRGG